MVTFLLSSLFGATPTVNFSDFTFHAAALGRFVPALLNAGLISHQGGAKAQLNLLPNLARYRFTTAREIEQG